MMESRSAPTGFSLVDEAWVPVLDVGGGLREVSLRELFARAHQLRMIACELPTQTFAILRLALAILHRATDGPAGEQAWRDLWRRSTLPSDVDGYLDEFQDRFDLLHPERPFYQVAGLQTAKGDTFGLERIIADVPASNSFPYLTSRTGEGLSRISPAEAARWLVHCQSYDTAGIKTGAVGDPNVVEGKGFGAEIGASGWLGGTYLEAASLRETLLLNLIPLRAGLRTADERDMPIWERGLHGPVEESDISRGPFGVLSLYTWQSRRVRFFGDRDGISRVIVAKGDKIDWQDRHLFEPMSGWRRSEPREKKLKRAPVYLPRLHDHTRALWRSLTTLLPQSTSSNNAPAEQLAPVVMQWLDRLSNKGLIGEDYRVTPRAVGMIYGAKATSIEQVFGDWLTMSVLVVQEGSELRITAVDSASDAEKAVQALRSLADDLVRAAAGSGVDNGSADRAAEAAYAQLDRRFRGWLAHLAPGSDPLEERKLWQRVVRKTVARLADALIVGAGPTAWVGRTITERNGKEVHYSSSQAEAWFRTRLRKTLPLANEFPTQAQEEVPA